MSSGAHEDQETLEVQLGRTLKGSSTVAARCGLGLPVVIRSQPLLEDGAPFPTLYYLTCPLARIRVSRLESGGLIRELSQRLEDEPELAAAHARAQEAYQSERDALLPADLDPAAPRPRGGVGGSLRGVKCLHAHYAHAKVGGPNPIGRMVMERVEPLNCPRPCALDGVSNPAWREPELDPGLT